MVKDAIRYAVIILIIVGIVLVMKSLISEDSNWKNDNTKNTNKTEEVLYNASISLIDKNTEELIEGANLVVKDENGEIIDSWTTTDEIYTITEIKPGTYTIEEDKAPEGYKLNEEGVTFKIENMNVDVAMYNEAMTEEELEFDKEQNTISNEIGVDNTLSSKNMFVTILSIISFITGLVIISYQITKRINYFNQ